MNLWSEEDKNDKETHTMLLDEEANKVDPWFAAFRAARMHDVIQKMSRVNCAEVFQYKLQLEEDDDVNEQTTSAAAANIVTINPETPEQRIARKRSSGAIPLDDGSGYRKRQLRAPLSKRKRKRRRRRLVRTTTIRLRPSYRCYYRRGR